MKNMSLKVKVCSKKFDYRLKSESLKYDNLLNRNFSTTDLNQKYTKNQKFVKYWIIK